jgi:hypothetical protein
MLPSVNLVPAMRLRSYLALTMALLVTSLAAADPWPAAGGKATRDRSMPGAGSLGPPQSKYSYPNLNGEVTVAADGMLYFGLGGGKGVVAIQSGSGQTVWHFSDSDPSLNYKTPILSPEGSIYAVADSPDGMTHIYSLTRGGNLQWQKNVPGLAAWNIHVAPNGALLFLSSSFINSCSEMALHAWSPMGNELWTKSFTLPQYTYGGNFSIDDDNQVYFVTESFIAVLDARNGAENRRFVPPMSGQKFNAEWNRPPLLAPQYVFVTGGTYRPKLLFAFEKVTGKCVWIRDFGGCDIACLALSPNGHLILGLNGLYVETNDRSTYPTERHKPAQLVSMNQTTGATVWAKEIEQEVGYYSTFLWPDIRVDQNNTIYVTPIDRLLLWTSPSGGLLRAYSDSGKLLWRLPDNWVGDSLSESKEDASGQQISQGIDGTLFVRKSHYFPTGGFEALTKGANIAANQPPTVEPISASTLVDRPVDISIAIGAKDPEGDLLYLYIESQPQHGFLTKGKYGEIVKYVPEAGFTGVDYFTYKAMDANSYSNVATVTINVINNLPVIASAASASSNPANVGQAIQFGVGATSSDSQALTYSWAFGDGLVATSAASQHTYAAPGNYAVSVTVSNATGSVKSTIDLLVLPIGTNAVTLTKAGNPLPKTTVTAVRASDSAVLMTSTTNASGVATFATLAKGQWVIYRVLDQNASFVSQNTMTPGDATINLPANSTVTVTKGGVPVAGVSVAAYLDIPNVTDMISIYSRVTDSTGKATFSLVEGGNEKFKVIDQGAAYWSSVITAPGASIIALPANTIVTVTKAGVPLAGALVSAFKSDGTSLPYNRITDASGQARFSITERLQVKIRAVDQGAVFWSSVITTPGAATIALPANTTVTVTRAGVPLAGAIVSAFKSDGTSLTYSRTTDPDGQTRFSITEGLQVKFKVVNQSITYWSNVFTTAGSATISLP